MIAGLYIGSVFQDLHSHIPVPYENTLVILVTSHFMTIVHTHRRKFYNITLHPERL